MRTILLLTMAGILACLTAATCYATPSKEFYSRDTEVYDDWGLCRTWAGGPNGFFQISEFDSKITFRPAIVFEGLGDHANAAYELGKDLARKYPDRNQLAEQIFYFVRDHVQYTPDVDQFEFDDFAQNADELAEAIKERGQALGDCEDYAALLAVMYHAAGFRPAVVLAPGHAAVLVHLPSYKRANVVWEFKGESGWIWAEATGARNPLGWTPQRYAGGGNLAAYEIDVEPVEVGQPPAEPARELRRMGGGVIFGASPFLSVIFFMWMLSAFRRAFARR
jgi:hypothetical protein